MKNKISVLFLAIAFQYGFSQIASDQHIGLALNWEVSGFSMPESVLASPDDDWVYVSNVNGDKSGYLSRLTKDGTVDDYKWVDNLGMPTGLGLYDNKLYVGAGSALHIIDTKNGTLLKSIVSKDAVSLNDVAISTDGKVYVSDVPGGKIYTLKNDILEVWFQDKSMSFPNGIYIDNGYMYVGDYGGGLQPDFSAATYGSFYKIDLKDKSFELVAPGFKLGALDGVAKFKNRFLISGNPAGELFSVTEKDRVLLGTFPKGMADISVADNVLYAPFFYDGKVLSYRLSSKSEDNTMSLNTPEMVNQLVKFKVKTEYRNEFRKVAVASLNGSLKEPGNIAMMLFEDTTDPTVIYVYSKWKDLAAIAYHNEQDYGKKIKKLAQTALAAPPEISTLNEIIEKKQNTNNFKNKIMDWKRILTKQEYLDKAANVFFGDEGGQSVATKSGNIFGIFNDQELSGTWDWKDGFFCRTSTLGDLDLGSDCILIEVTDTQMRLTMEKGKGFTVVYDRK